IVAARLDRVVAPFRHLEPIQQRLRDDPLFPLGRPWQDRFLADRIDVRPRDVVNWAREGWRTEQETLRRIRGRAWLEGGGSRRPAIDVKVVPPTEEEIRAAIDRKVAEKVEELMRERQATPDTLPPDANHLTGLITRLLRQCLDAGPLYGL